MLDSNLKQAAQMLQLKLNENKRKTKKKTNEKPNKPKRKKSRLFCLILDKKNERN